MSTSPKISVVIPVYNRENLVTASIESLLNQSTKCHEIVVVDDGSTDNTLDVIKRYGNEINIIRKDNGGSASARNAGLNITSGDYIAYIDSDDTWHPDKLSTYIDYIESCKQPENLFMFSDFRRYDIKNKEYLPLSQTEIYPLIFDYFTNVNDSLYTCKGIELLKCLLRPYPFYPSTFLMSRHLHDKYLWNEDLILCEDFEIVLRMCKEISFYYIDTPLSTIGIHDSNQILDMDKVLQGDIDAIKAYSSTLADNKNEKSMCNYEVGKRYWEFGQYSRKNNNYLFSLKYYIHGLLYVENVKRLFKSLYFKIANHLGNK